jgi:hypothetical protein
VKTSSLSSARQVWYRVIVLLGLLPLSACLAKAPGSGGGGGGGGSQPLTVTVSPSMSPPMSVPVNTSTQPSTVQFSATVGPSGSSQDVTWSLAPGLNSGCSATGNGLGSITSGGLYTAPPTIAAAPCTVAVTATSTANTSYSGFAAIIVHVVVSISPATDTIGQGANLQYVATVIGTPTPTSDQTVNWAQPTCPTCPGGQTAGGFDANNPGLYVAPGFQTGTSSAAVIVSAASTFDPTASSGTATITVQQTDALGKVSNQQSVSSCPADSNGKLANGKCYSIDVSCDGVADLTTYLKVNASPVAGGTVLFVIGSGGDGLYDNNPLWQYGYETVENVFAANFNTVQVSFGDPFANGTQPNGWLQGPGGVRRLACRYATVADWVYNNPQALGLNTPGATSAPLCATGNSGGSSAVAYAAFEYGLAGTATTGPAQEFTMIEPTAGPVTTRLDEACVCNNGATGPDVPSCDTNTGPTSMCYTPSEAAIIDPAYQVQGQPNQPTLCSDGLSGTNATNFNRFASDSIDYAPDNTIPIPLSKTLVVNMRFGALDTTTGVPQGEVWWGAVRPQPPQPDCTLDASHELPGVSDGATDIANDIITQCVLPPGAQDRGKARK